MSLVNVNSFLICNKCRELKQITNYMKIIDVQTYGIESDKDGFIKKVRFYKSCIDCRKDLRKLAKITRNLKKLPIFVVFNPNFFLSTNYFFSFYLISARRTPLTLNFIDNTVSKINALVLFLILHRPFEKAFATFTRQNSIMISSNLIPTDRARLFILVNQLFRALKR